MSNYDYECYELRIKEFRLARGITQLELADAVGTTPQMISKYERGDAIPSVFRLFDIAIVLDADIYSLIRFRY